MYTSKTIEEFLSFLRDSAQIYHIRRAEQEEQEKITQDILHSLELDNLNYRDTAKAATRLREARQKRREAKDAAEELEPIEQYVRNNQPEIKALERLLGDVRKVERKHENRIYIPKSQKEAAHD